MEHTQILQDCKEPFSDYISDTMYLSSDQSEDNLQNLEDAIDNKNILVTYDDEYRLKQTFRENLQYFTR